MLPSSKSQKGSFVIPDVDYLLFSRLAVRKSDGLTINEMRFTFEPEKENLIFFGKIRNFVT